MGASHLAFTIRGVRTYWFASDIHGEIAGFAVDTDSNILNPPFTWVRGRLLGGPPSLRRDKDTIRWVLESSERLGSRAEELLSEYEWVRVDGLDGVISSLSVLRWGRQRVQLNFYPLKAGDDPIETMLALLSSPARGVLLRIVEAYQLGVGIFVDSLIPTDADGPKFILGDRGSGFDRESSQIAAAELPAVVYWLLRQGNIRLRWNEERQHRRKSRQPRPAAPLTATVEELTADPWQGIDADPPEGEVVSDGDTADEGIRVVAQDVHAGEAQC